jgi:hypothetical protein
MVRSPVISAPSFEAMESCRNDSSRRPPLLTLTELRVLAAVEDLSEQLGYAPSHTQLLEQLGWSPKSRGSLNAYLKRLERHGVIAGAGRALRVTR